MKELEDYPWFPAFLRDFQTAFIGFVVVRFAVYKPLIDHVNALQLPPQPITDLCSGSGEPAISIFKQCPGFTRLELTDKYPVTIRASVDMVYLPESVDVLDMAFEPGRIYTMFNAFHHFDDADKLRITERIQATGSRAFFVEILEPNVVFILKILFITTIGNLLLTPFIRPFSGWRLVLTYLIPVNIFTIAYDGIVSVFKSRSVRQYQQLFAGRQGVSVFKLQKGLRSLVVIQTDPLA